MVYTVAAEDGGTKDFRVSVVVPFSASEIAYPGASATRAFTAVEPYIVNVMGTNTSVPLYGASRTYDFSGDVPFINLTTLVADPAQFQAWDAGLGVSRTINSNEMTNSGFSGRIEKWNGMTMIRYNAGDGITAGACRTQLNSYPIPPRSRVRFDMDVAFGASDAGSVWVPSGAQLSPVLFWQVRSSSGTNPSMSAIVDTDPTNPQALAIYFNRKGGASSTIELVAKATGLPRNTLVPITVEAFLDEREMSNGGKGRMKVTVNGTRLADIDGPTLTFGNGLHNWSLDMYLYNEITPYTNTRASFWKTARLVVLP